MRTWRVGSISMGGALVLLGVFLLLQQFLGWNAAITLAVWWPVLSIVLGIEILFYLWKKQDDEQRIKYDFISIFFIGIIGTASIFFAIVQSSGLVDISRQVLASEYKEFDVPVYEEADLADVKRISISGNYFPMTIEATNGKELSMFGTYSVDAEKGKNPLQSVADYALVEKQGDTIYIKLKEMPHQRFPDFRGSLDLTVLIPAHIQLEFDGDHSFVQVNARYLKSDWQINNSSAVEVKIPKNSDLTLEARQIDSLFEQDWEKIEKDDESGEIKSAIKTYGKGSHLLTIQNIDGIEIFD